MMQKGAGPKKRMQKGAGPNRRMQKGVGSPRRRKTQERAWQGVRMREA